MKYTIKPLEWELLDTAYIARTVFGRYLVSQNLTRNWWIINPEGSVSQPYKTADEAKAAAEAQYQQRITPALVGAGEK